MSERTKNALEWLLRVLVEGLGVSIVVGTILMALIRPQIEQWIDAKIAPLVVRDDQFDRWRIEHERWAGQRDKQIEGILELESALRQRNELEIDRLRNRVERVVP